jgi:hypothetical protein
MPTPAEHNESFDRLRDAATDLLSAVEVLRVSLENTRALAGDVRNALERLHADDEPLDPRKDGVDVHEALGIYRFGELAAGLEGVRTSAREALARATSSLSDVGSSARDLATVRAYADTIIVRLFEAEAELEEAVEADRMMGDASP